jgi:[protein-PII] uridylyltransferase
MRQNADQVMTAAWKALHLPTSTCLVAVGGYGRGELFPHSDIDLLILLDQAPDLALQAQLEKLVQLFWDLGLEIGHSIRTVEECLTESAADITVQTSLLEARLITGNRALFQSLQQRYQQAMDARAFFQDKNTGTQTASCEV